MSILLLPLAILLAACSQPEQGVKDCLPAAIAAREIMEKQGVAAKVLVVHWKEDSRERGHAYTIFRYGKKWSYDKDFGSIALTSGMDGPQWEAWEANFKRGLRGQITKAEYLEVTQ
jgi:hypothetical protein